MELRAARPKFVPARSTVSRVVQLVETEETELTRRGRMERTVLPIRAYLHKWARLGLVEAGLPMVLVSVRRASPVHLEARGLAGAVQRMSGALPRAVGPRESVMSARLAIQAKVAVEVEGATTPAAHLAAVVVAAAAAAGRLEMVAAAEVPLLRCSLSTLP